MSNRTASHLTTLYQPTAVPPSGAIDGFIRRPKVFTRKPPKGAQINWNHPLSQGLIFCYLFNEGAWVPVDLVKNVKALLPGGSPKWTTRGGDPAMEFFDTSDYISFGDRAEAKGLGKLTVCSRVLTDTITGGGASRRYIVNFEGSASGWMLRLSTVNASFEFYVNVGGTFYGALGAGSSVSTGAWYNLAGRFDRSLSSNRVSLFVNGYNTANNNGADGNIISPSGQEMRVGAPGVDTTRDWDGVISYFYLYNISLSNAAIREIHYNPYAFLAHPGRILISVPGITETQLSFSTTTTPTATIKRDAGKIISATATSVASLLRDVRLILALTSGPIATESHIKTILQSFTATAVSIAAVIRNIQLTRTAITAPIATILRSPQILFSAIAISIASIRRSISKNFSTTTLAQAFLIRRVNKILSATGISIANESHIKTILQNLSVVVTANASILKAVQKNFSITETPNVLIIKLTRKNFIVITVPALTLIRQIQKRFSVISTPLVTMTKAAVTFIRKIIFTSESLTGHKGTADTMKTPDAVDERLKTPDGSDNTLI